MTVRLLAMNLDRNRHRLRAVVMPMVAVWPVNMRRWGDRRGRHCRFGIGVVVPVTPSAVRTGFRLKRFIDLVHDQVHGPQQICQYMIRLDFQVVGLEFDGHVAVAQVVGSP